MSVEIEDCDGDDIQSEVCEHVAVDWEPGVTGTGVKLGKCRHCGEQVERDVS